MSSSSLVSSSSRPLKVRVRPDLQYVPQTWQGRDYWIVKDPLSLKFYRFEEEEYVLLKLLDGVHSADEIRQEFAKRFAPQNISNRELFQFIGSLYRSSLLVSDASGQAVSLLQRSDKSKKQERRAKLTNILAIRFRGFDPDGLLTVLNRYTGWIFAKPVVISCCLLILSAITLVLTNFEYFQSRLPAFQEFFAAQNWIWLGLILALTKVWHELGHGLACKRFGSQCHSMGVMFLVLMPCLYCDVSDSWTLRSKWKRAAIAAAGMYFEFLLASLCVFVWWFSEPGWVNMLALNVVFVCSVSTVLFNANPLLRYDGYYILSDLIEVPNLRQKATTVLKRFCSQVLLGLESQPDPFMPQRRRWLFATYSILAVLYRWFITLSIFWFLYRLLEPYGLKLIGQAIAMMALWGLLGVPLIQLYRFFSTPGRISAVKPVRLGVTTGVFAAIVVGILLVPVPHYVRCSFIVQHEEAANIYVEMSGIVDSIHVREADTVQPGQPLVTLASPELIDSIVQLEGEEQIARQRYLATRQQSHYDEAADADVEARLVSWQAISNQLQQRREALRQLNIQAPVQGRVVTASYVAEKQNDDGRLATWYGHPLEPRNRGAWLEEGTVVCQIVPENHRLEAILAIDQTDIEFVANGNPVELWLRQQPGKLLSANIERISPVAMETVPKALGSEAGGSIATTVNDAGDNVPQSATYQVRVPLQSLESGLPIGSTGLARVRTGNQTVGSRIWRFLCKTFRFDL